jgi:hypothetical protein
MDDMCQKSRNMLWVLYMTKSQFNMVRLTKSQPLLT